MTIDEKRRAIIKYCLHRHSCEGCLLNRVGVKCSQAHSYDEIERDYEILDNLYGTITEASMDKYGQVKVTPVTTTKPKPEGGNGAVVDVGMFMQSACSDPISPNHYKREGGIECIDALKDATRDLKGIDAVCTANAIKYLWRWKEKNGVQDLNKAIWYIKRLIKENGGIIHE